MFSGVNNTKNQQANTFRHIWIFIPQNDKNDKKHFLIAQGGYKTVNFLVEYPYMISRGKGFVNSDTVLTSIGRLLIQA